jgi:hypothetical protein
MVRDRNISFDLTLNNEILLGGDLSLYDQCATQGGHTLGEI